MKYISWLVCLLTFLSCSKDIDIPQNEETVETINGFTVKWRSQVTDAQRRTICNILENMVTVDGGTFTMGATPEQKEFARFNEYPLCYVRLSSYYICKYEVSDEDYINIVGDPRKGTSALFLNWEDWNTFIKALREISSVNFDFPTEAQWEFAARGGNDSNGYVYPGSDNLEDVWTDSEVVGSNTPNELGLYNMADLKSEWCKDFYTDCDATEFFENRCITSGKYHVVRGGNYWCQGETKKYLTSTTGEGFGYFKSVGSVLSPFDYRYCRITARSHGYPSVSNRYIGCRLVINK